MHNIIKFESPYSIREYYRHGLVHLLSHYHYYHAEGMDEASAHGHVAILRWVISSGLPLTYTSNAMDWASLHGHDHVLDWWKNSSLIMKYTECAIEFASVKKQIHVLDWWLNSSLPITYTEQAVFYGYVYHYDNIIEWFKVNNDRIQHLNSMQPPPLQRKGKRIRLDKEN